ncbi:MAG: hypothetical protein ACETV0_01220 [Nitrososphaeria archaeon]
MGIPLQNSKLADANLAIEQRIMAASGWLDHRYAKRLDKLIDRSLRWNAAVAIANLAATTLAVSSLMLLLIDAR